MLFRSGSDVVSMKTRADKRGDRFVLNGSKMWITNGPVAETLVVYAKTDPQAGARGVSAFVVEPKVTDGITVAPAERTMGLRGGHVFGVTFDDCFVPEENRIGAEGLGQRPVEFVVGGGVSKKSDKFLPLLELETPVEVAQLRNNAGIVGAALWAEEDQRRHAAG